MDFWLLGQGIQDSNC